MTFNDDKPFFSNKGDATPHYHTASTKRYCSVCAAISIAFSNSSLHVGFMIQLAEAKSRRITEHDVLPHVQATDWQHLQVPEAQNKASIATAEQAVPVGREDLSDKVQHIYCSAHKCMFLISVAPFKRRINRLSNYIRFISKK